MIKFSIVCPVYNTEKYIKRCINSVIVQSYFNWELILINDGSTDNSLDVCLLFLSEKRIFLINQDNKGQYEARKRGLINAKGDYILFLDSDDFYADKDALLFLKNKIDVYHQDILFFSYKTDNEKLNTKFMLNDEDENDISNRPISELFSKRLGYYLWDKCFKKSLITYALEERYNFSFSNFGEDTLLLFSIVKHAKNIGIYNSKLYFYSFNPNSTIQTLTSNDLIGRNNIYIHIYGFLLKEGIDIDRNVLQVYDELVIHQISLYLDLKHPSRSALKQLYLTYKKYNIKINYSRVSKTSIRIVLKLFEKRLYLLIIFIRRLYKLFKPKAVK